MDLLTTCEPRRIKVYGKTLGDGLETKLAEKVVELGNVHHVLLHSPKPISAKPCQRPGTRLGQLVLQTGRVLSFRSSLDGTVRAI